MVADSSMVGGDYVDVGRHILNSVDRVQPYLNALFLFLQFGEIFGFLYYVDIMNYANQSNYTM